MNLAYAAHEIISDYTTAAFMWFEGGCAVCAWVAAGRRETGGHAVTHQVSHRFSIPPRALP